MESITIECEFIMVHTFILQNVEHSYICFCYLFYHTVKTSYKTRSVNLIYLLYYLYDDKLTTIHR